MTCHGCDREMSEPALTLFVRIKGSFRYLQLCDACLASKVLSIPMARAIFYRMREANPNAQENHVSVLRG